MATKIGVVRMHIQLPGSDSLKAKRSRLKPLLTRLQREFNISAAEVDYQEMWGDALICCALVSTDTRHAQRFLQKVVDWVERYWPDVDLMGEEFEILQ